MGTCNRDSTLYRSQKPKYFELKTFYVFYGMYNLCKNVRNIGFYGTFG